MIIGGTIGSKHFVNTSGDHVTICWRVPLVEANRNDAVKEIIGHRAEALIISQRGVVLGKRQIGGHGAGFERNREHLRVNVPIGAGGGAAHPSADPFGVERGHQLLPQRTISGEEAQLITNFARDIVEPLGRDFATGLELAQDAQFHVVMARHNVIEFAQLHHINRSFQLREAIVEPVK